MAPGPAYRAPHDEPRRFRSDRAVLPGLGGILKRAFIALDDLFEHFGGDDTWQIRTSRGGRQGQSQTNEIMRWISDNRLIKITNLDLYAALGIGDGTEIADMAIATNPDGWPLR